MINGYIKLWRSVSDNPMWLSEPFTRSQAWIDMLLMANHKPSTVRVRGILVEVNTGQLLAGEDFLAKRWKWSRGKVRRFMSELSSKSVQQIEQQKTNVITVTTILNWNLYQGNGTANGTPSSTTDGQQTVQQTDTPKNDKKDKNEKNGISGGEDHGNYDCRESETTNTDDPAGIVRALKSFPCNDGSEWFLTNGKLSELEDAYRGMDVLGECRKARVWIINNPKRRKTRSGMPRFLSNWMSNNKPKQSSTEYTGRLEP